MYLKLTKYCKVPDKTILLVDDYDKCISRATKRDKMDYNDKEKYILNKSYEYFIKMSLKYNERFYIINLNKLSENEVLNRMIEIINV